jgi:hypothetical protein
VFNAQGLVCGCVNGSSSAAHTGDVFGKQSSKYPDDAGLDKHCTLKMARATGFGEGRGPTWPFGTHHVDGGVWNAWVYACANHIRRTRGTRR